jgi:hypothetical protein
MHINDLQNNQTVTARVGRGGRTQVEWSEWTDHVLCVQRTKHGTICIAPQMCWAEYRQQDLCRDDDGQGAYFLVEDYYFQIRGLEA